MQAEIATLTGAVVEELQDQATVGLHRASLGQRLGHEARHMVQHMNPRSIAHGLYIKSVRYGTAVAIAATVGELSEWASLALAAAFPTHPIGWLAGIYGAAHIGDIIAVNIVIGYPYLAARWDRISSIQNVFGGPAAYRRALQQARADYPIDWSIDPYWAQDDGFIVLRQKKGILGWMTRIFGHGAPDIIRRYVDIRVRAQEKAYPTISIQQLESIAKRFGIAHYDNSVAFDARVASLIAQIKASPVTRSALEQVLQRARLRAIHNLPAPAPHGLDTLRARAERARVLMLSQYEELRQLERALVHGDQFNLLNKWTRKLMSLAYQVEAPNLTEEQLTAMQTQASQIYRIFSEKEPGYLRRMKEALLNGTELPDHTDLHDLSTDQIQAIQDTITWEAWKAYGLFRRDVSTNHPGWQRLRHRMQLNAAARAPILIYRNGTSSWLAYQGRRLVNFLTSTSSRREPTWESLRVNSVILFSELEKAGVDVGNDEPVVILSAPTHCSSILTP
jgi:hypothetical protein